MVFWIATILKTLEFFLPYWFTIKGSYLSTLALPGLGFSETLPAISMGIPIASGLGRRFSSKLPAIPMGIPMELFLWVFLWPVAEGEGFPLNYQLFLWVFL